MAFSFSYSRWTTWAECPAKYKFKHIDKLSEPKSAAMQRGIDIHSAVADYVSAKTPDMPAELKHFTALADQLRSVPSDYKMVEQQMAFDKEERRCDWFGPNAYWRFIWDVGVVNGKKTTVNSVDWKAGKPRGSYDAQMQIFAIPAYWLFPALESFTGHLVYLDVGDTVAVTYDRAAFYGPTCDPAARDGLYGLWLANVGMMEADRAFRATPSRDACRFCHFSARKGGPCQEGV